MTGSFLLISSVGEEGGEGGSHTAHRHGLQGHLSGASDHGVKDALSAKEHVLDPLDGLDIDGAGGVHHGQVARVHHDLLPWGQLVLHGIPVDFHKGGAAARELLHHKALAAEEAGTQLFLEKDGQFHALLRGQKGAFLQDNGLVRDDLDGADGAGEAGGEGNHSRPALGGIDVLKDGITRKHAPEGLAQAAGRSLHVHIRAHPAHGAFLCDHGLLGVELANDCGQGLANNLVLHFNAPLYDRN